MRILTFENDAQVRAFVKKEWLKYHSMRGEANLPSQPAYVGAAGVYETPPLALPQTTTKVIFSLAAASGFPGGGACRIIDIFGVITTVIGSVANATKLKVITTDSAGTALTAVDLCATLDINAKPLGGSLSITGTLANAMTENDNGVQIAMVTPVHFTFGPTATIVLDCAGSDGGTGRVKWYLIAQVDYGTNVNPQQA